MPQETPEQSARVAQKISLGCLGILLLGLGVFAGIAVWALVTGRGIGFSGWLYIVCFLVFAAGFWRAIRRLRNHPASDRGSSNAG